MSMNENHQAVKRLQYIQDLVTFDALPACCRTRGDDGWELAAMAPVLMQQRVMLDSSGPATAPGFVLVFKRQADLEDHHAPSAPVP